MLAASLLAAGCADDGAATMRPVDTTVDAGRRKEPTGTTEPQSDQRSATGPGGGGGGFARALEPFDDCAAFVDHVKAEAAARVGPYGLDQEMWPYEEREVEEAATEEPAAEEPAEAPAAEPAAPTSGSDDGHSSTNVQESGVDEADLVKTDGDRIVVVRGSRLIHVDITGPTPRVTDEITVPAAYDLFLHGDRALLFAHTEGYDEWSDQAVGPHGERYESATQLVEIDLADPGDLEVTATLRVEGRYLSARLIDDTVRIAISTGARQLPWVYPQGPAGEERAERTNRELIEETTLADWVPEYRLAADGAETSGSLVPCDRMRHPADFAGFDVVTLLEIDLAEGLASGFDPATATGVLAGGQTVYSSLDRFYVATTEWVPPGETGDGIVMPEWSENYETELHAFAIAPDAPPRYVGSGAVPGTLLNQFSLDEHDGYLRVITTTGTPWGGRDASESTLTVMDEQGDRLVAVGSVGGLGKGETLYSARLLDDVGFAVTFRQVDPFYVLDLRDPADPRVTGELKIPGFSTYLHPLDANRVIGIGQDATLEGQVQGLKVSMFDVSDPTAPRETAVWTMPNATSATEYDHRAFQLWGTTAILPIENWSGGLNGVVLLDVSDGIREIGRIEPRLADGSGPSDCRELSADDFPGDPANLWWVASDPSMHFQLCREDDRGGWHGQWCEPIPVDQFPMWVGVPIEGADLYAHLGATEQDRIEMCYWYDGAASRVERSLVADGVLYLVTPDALQANRLDDLSHIATVPLS